MNAPLSAIVPSRRMSGLHLLVGYIYIVALALLASMMGYWFYLSQRPTFSYEYALSIATLGSVILGGIAWIFGVYFVVHREININVRWLPLFLLAFVIASNAVGAGIIREWGGSGHRQNAVVSGTIGGFLIAVIVIAVLSLILDLGFGTQPTLPPLPLGGILISSAHLFVAYVSFVALAMISSMAGYGMFVNNKNRPQITFEYNAVVSVIGSAVLGAVPLAIGLYYTAVLGFDFSSHLRRTVTAPGRSSRWNQILLLPIVVAVLNAFVVVADGERGTGHKGETVFYGGVGGIVVMWAVIIIGAIFDLIGSRTQPVLPPQPPGGALGTPILIPVGLRGGRPGGAERIALSVRS